LSDGSGTTAGVISLPKGGGALGGLGEKFAPDLHTGTANFSVPITVPPGRNGFQPRLSLLYSSGHPNGVFGMGWSQSVSEVRRKTSKGTPTYDETEDVFILSEVDDLVRVPDLRMGATSYRPRTEGFFARIERIRAPNDDHWEIRSKDGMASVYGSPLSVGTDPATVRDPRDPSKVFSWKLTRTSDPFGNHIDYVYERDANRTDGPHQWDQVYLAEIRYVDHGGAANPGFLVTIRFVYELRPDPFSSYRSGFEVRTVRRCIRIEIATHPGNDTPVRTYHLGYLDQQGLAFDKLPRNSVSLLGRIEVEGHDGATSAWMPPLAFDYTRFEPDRRRFTPVTGPDTPPGSLARPDYELADLFGNGLPDVLEMNGKVRYWRNLGRGQLDWPKEMVEAPAGVRLADPGIELIDANGDGRPDLLVSRESLSGYYPMRFGGLWDRRSFQPYRTAPSFDLKDAEVRLVDLDGDGVTDAIRSGSRLECFFNDPKDGWISSRELERQAVEVFPNVSFADPRVKWADMTGDGLQDVVVVYDGVVEYWPSLGRGEWGQRVTMRDSPRFPAGYDPHRILMGDVDGDGVADLLYVDDEEVTVWINHCGNGWAQPVTIQGTPPVTDLDGLRVTDFEGTGVAGVLWSTDSSSVTGAQMYFLDMTGGIKPYLLERMDNHLGAVTRVGYASSTRFYLEDQKLPRSRWKTTLPFPVQVVATVEVIDEISGGKLTTEYSYHHGYWDGAEREFRGFGRVVHRDSESFEDFHSAGLHPPDQAFAGVPPLFFSPPTETRTWFHLGPVGDEFGDWDEVDFSSEYRQEDPSLLSRPPTMTVFLAALPRRVRRDALRTLRGQVLRVELYGLDDSDRKTRPYTVTEHLHGVTSLPVGDPWPANPESWREHVFFPVLLAERASQWERGNDPMTNVTAVGEYDRFGQVESQIHISVPRGRDYRRAGVAGEAYLATYAVTSRAQRDDLLHYIVDRIARVTTFEILNDGSSDVLTLRDRILDGSAPRSIIGQELHFYDGPAFEGLPFGKVGDYGAVVRTESLVLTKEVLYEAYKSGAVVLNQPEEPPYLATAGLIAWTAEYPAEFQARLPPLAGYTYRPGAVGSEYATGFFAATERRRFDFHDGAVANPRGLITVKRDCFGADTSITYEEYSLVAIDVGNSAGLHTKATYDYRVLQPSEIIDANGNRTGYTFTPLGLLATIAVMGRANENLGDTPADPSTRLAYDFRAYTTLGRPISVWTSRRVHSVNEVDIPLPERNATLESIEYSDGFGRLLQSRTQAEDVLMGGAPFGAAGLPADPSIALGSAQGSEKGPLEPTNVVVSGSQVYDNKGQVVEKYEPFFSSSLTYAAPSDAERGRKLTIFYDPRGQRVRTVHPDGSETRQILGIPNDLSDPDHFMPTAWEAYIYDQNDNAGRTHPALAGSYKGHWNTPTSVVRDGYGRTILRTERKGPDPMTDWFVTRSAYDIRGNRVEVTDASGRIADRTNYDLHNQPIRIERLDAGVRRMILDSAGNPVEQRGSAGALSLYAYDSLNRPTRLWARDATEQPLTLRELTIYGDSQEVGIVAAQAMAANLLGRVVRQYDEAGLLAMAAYDFRGRILEKRRQVVKDAAILAWFDQPGPNWQVPPYVVDWQPELGTTLELHAAGFLEGAVYQTVFTYDSLDRLKSIRFPADADGPGKEIVPIYNRAGALERLTFDGALYVERIAYNAKGQRTLIVYGNGVMTRYCYDPTTFRMARLRTERYKTPAPLTYQPVGGPLQDFSYAYDLSGNILSLKESVAMSGVPNSLEGPDALSRTFTYDPLYRLLSSNGRECAMAPTEPWDGSPRGDDITKVRAYGENYQYDAVDNLTWLKHIANGSGFTRDYSLADGTNRIARMSIGATVYDYTYDAAGRLTDETSSRHFEWDHKDRMHVYRAQTWGSEPSIFAQYFYDPSGERVKKVVRHQGGSGETTRYVDGAFEHYRVAIGAGIEENNVLHVMDGPLRIALVRVGPVIGGDPTPSITYQLADHLGSSHLTVDQAGNWIKREEYTPYGESSFGSFARKRYRYTGKERDEESGLTYHGARYYAAWLGRWISCDPVDSNASSFDRRGYRPYVYVDDRPLVAIDPTGKFLATALGALGGAVIGGGAALLGGGTLEEVGAATARGAVTGAMVGLVIDTGGASLPLLIAAGALANAEGATVERALLGKPTTPLDVASDLAAGATASMVTEMLPMLSMMRNPEMAATNRMLPAQDPINRPPLAAAQSHATSPLPSTPPAAAPLGGQTYDVAAGQIVPRIRVAPKIGSYRGVTRADQSWAQRVGERWTGPGKYDAGHATPLAHTPPGGRVVLRSEPQAINRAAGADIARSNKVRPSFNLYVRPKPQGEVVR
jgi:RHS repeat-associated protein